MDLPAITPARGSLAPSARSAGAARAFTLVEILVSLAVIAILVAILFPALARGIGRARAFRCQMNLRGVAFDFTVFADSTMHPARGDDDERFGRNRFSLETFIESEYQVDEFWPRNEPRTLITRSDDPNADPMRCASIAGDLTMRRNTPCRAGALTPPRSVSFGFNSRLFRIETVDARGRVRTQEVTLRPDITTHGMVPLAWDIEGEAAGNLGVPPHFSAPSLDSRGPYRNDRYWWPGRRHAAHAHFALIDGSVHDSDAPTSEPGWRWDYQPNP